MNNRYLMQELLEIQEEYKQLLEELCDEKEKDEFIYVIEEISLFWYSKRNIVELIMENISEDFDAYLFTGATYLDMEEGEHYPFISLGKIHIVDDPLAKYAEAIKINLNDTFYKTMRNQIVLAFDDDLRILRECLGKVFLIPVTALTLLGDGIIKKSSNQILLSMFKGEVSIKEIFSIKSLSELIFMLKDGIKEQIVFLEDEDRNENILERFKKYLKEMNNPFGNIQESHQFLYSILGFISQSLEILLCTVQYKLIPYIRYGVTFNYLMIISGNFLDVSHMQDIIFKMAFAHYFYKKFDWKLVELAEFSRYCNVIEQIDIIEQLEKQMKNKYDFNTITFENMNRLIEDSLGEIRTNIIKINK